MVASVDKQCWLASPLAHSVLRPSADSSMHPSGLSISINQLPRWFLGISVRRIDTWRHQHPACPGVRASCSTDCSHRSTWTLTATAKRISRCSAYCFTGKKVQILTHEELLELPRRGIFHFLVYLTPPILLNLSIQRVTAGIFCGIENEDACTSDGLLERKAWYVCI